MAKTPKRPRDANQLAKHIVDLATGAARRVEGRRREGRGFVAGATGGDCSEGGAEAVGQKIAIVNWNQHIILTVCD